jgi:hypothetical protein
MFAFTHFYSFAGFLSVFSFGLGRRSCLPTHPEPACLHHRPQRDNIITFFTQVLWYA